MSLLLLALLQLSGGALDLQDEVGCPSHDAVLDSLRLIAPQAAEARHTVHLKPVEGELLLQLDDATGAVLASRRLPASADCSKVAEMVAVILAAWEAQFSHEPTVVPPSPAVGPTPAVVQPPVEASTATPPPADGSHRFGVTGLVLASADSSGAGIAGELGGGIDWFDAAIFIEAAHQAPLGPGEVHWQRGALELGGSLRLSARPVTFDARAFALVALLGRWGSGYPENEGSVHLDGGLGLGLRAALPLGAGIHAVAAVSLVTWPAPQRIAVAGLPEVYTVPQFQLFAGLGASYESETGKGSGAGEGSR